VPDTLQVTLIGRERQEVLERTLAYEHHQVPAAAFRADQVMPSNTQIQQLPACGAKVRQSVLNILVVGLPTANRRSGRQVRARDVVRSVAQPAIVESRRPSGTKGIQQTRYAVQLRRERRCTLQNRSNSIVDYAGCFVDQSLTGRRQSRHCKPSISFVLYG